jgi:hypothetical protein
MELNVPVDQTRQNCFRHFSEQPLYALRLIKQPLQGFEGNIIEFTIC